MELGHQLRVGNAFAMWQFARRQQKNDQRDAELLLDLLLFGDFPPIHVPSPANRDVLSLVRYRHRLVRIRTALKNGLQAVRSASPTAPFARGTSLLSAIGEQIRQLERDKRLGRDLEGSSFASWSSLYLNVIRLQFGRWHRSWGNEHTSEG